MVRTWPSHRPVSRSSWHAVASAQRLVAVAGLDSPAMIPALGSRLLGTRGARSRAHARERAVRLMRLTCLGIPAIATLTLVTSLLGFASPAGPAPVRAATPELTVVASTRYDVQPDEGHILVTADLTITNHAVDTATTKYFYDQAFLAVPPEADGFAVTGGFGRANWTISERKPTYTLLSLTFGGRLNAGATTKLRLTYALADPGSPPDRAVRVSRTLVTFPVWALASTGTAGSTVTLSVPAEYTVTFIRGSMGAAVTDPAGNQVWTSGPVADPLKFDVAVRADRPLQFVEVPRSVTVAGGTVKLVFRAWIDDSAWLDRMEQLYQDGIPRLAADIGRPWPFTEPLTIEEALNAPAEGIAGTFDPATHTIQVIYNAGPEVALHEAAHAWFNGGLLADRWANEAFASYYAEQVASAMGLPFEPAVITPALQAVALPLNAWAAGDAAPAKGAENSAQEAYGYAASVELARRIADAAGSAGLQRVWAAIGDGVAPYQPPNGPAEVLSSPPDWRGLLDLLEDNGTTHVAGLWATYVVRAEEASMLANRTVARRAYADAIARAGDWGLPRSIRDAMRSWQFDTARQQLAQATTVFDERDALAAAASKAGLTMPAVLGRTFTDATDLSTVVSLVKAEGDAATAIETSRQARPASIGMVEWIGLLGSRPDQQVESAIAAFESGDPGTAITDAAGARSSWEAAAETGRLRLIVLVAALALILVVVLIVRFGRSRATLA